MSKEERIEVACKRRKYQSKNLKLLLTLITHVDVEQVPSGRGKAYSHWNLKYNGKQLKTLNIEAALRVMA